MVSVWVAGTAVAPSIDCAHTVHASTIAIARTSIDARTILNDIGILLQDQARNGGLQCKRRKASMPSQHSVNGKNAEHFANQGSASVNPAAGQLNRCLAAPVDWENSQSSPPARALESW